MSVEAPRRDEMMLKNLSDKDLALLLELVDARRADVRNGIYVIGGQDAQDALFNELDALYEHLNDPNTEIHATPIPTQRRLPQGSARTVEFA